MYTLKTTDHASIQVTSEQRYKILEAMSSGDRFIHINDNTIMTNAITGIYTQEAHDRTEGVLHDGTKVVKKFGQWVDARDPSVKLDPHYYPEILTDTVPSLEEYQVKLLQNKS